VKLYLDDKFTIPLDFTFNVHSENPVRKENIEVYLRNYLVFRTTISNGMMKKYDRLHTDVSYGEKNT
jgi:hypothetical protein